jgi:hypothetical protein
VRAFRFSVVAGFPTDSRQRAANSEPPQNGARSRGATNRLHKLRAGDEPFRRIEQMSPMQAEDDPFRLINLPDRTIGIVEPHADFG